MSNRLNIADLFFKQVTKSPDQLAIIDGKYAVSFDELKIQVEQYMAYLQSKGIGKGDRILVFVPMGIPLYTAVLAILKIGAVAVFLDQWSGLKRLNTVCEIANCKAFLSGWKGRLIGLLSVEIWKIPIKLGINPSEKKAGKSTVEGTISSDAALITFTTGSTGVPKAAYRTHGFLTAQFEVLSKEVDPNLSKVDMPVLPIVLLINLGKGVTSVIADYVSHKPQDLIPAKIVRQLKEQEVSSITASPYFVAQLSLFLQNNPTEKEGLSIKRVFTGGAAVFPDEAAHFQRAFSDASINILYGSTEAEPISVVNASDLVMHNVVDDGGLYVGEINYAAEVKIIPIVDEALAFQSEKQLDGFTLEEGQVGEIIVSGAHVLQQYYNNEAALKRNKIFIGDKCWHRTGDSGFLKGQQLFLTGPCKQMISYKEQLISVFVYEHLLTSVKGVEVATIVLFRNEVVAVVQANKNSEATVKALIAKSPALELIQKIAFLSDIPKDPRHHSKIEYSKLEQLISAKTLIDVSKS